MYYKEYHGLCEPYSGKSLRLEQVDVCCDVTHLTSLVETTFVYKNQMKKPIEASFTFPLADVAVFWFEALIDDRRIVAECRPKKEAQSVYDEAVTQGHTAFVAHQDESSPDIFTMNVGRIPVNSVVTIKLKYVGQLDAENVVTSDFKGSEVTFTLPSVICPRYQPSKKHIKKEFDPTLEPTVFVEFPYEIGFKANLCMPGVIDSVVSNKDHYTVDVDKSNPKLAKVTLDSGFKPDHSLQMIIRMKQTLESFAVIEDGNSKQISILAQTCVMAQFMPDFSTVLDEQDLRSELIFVVDRSGSMEGSRIQHAAESLMLFLGSLPPGVRFQIIGFGSTHMPLFPEPVDYNETTLALARDYQSSMDADMGGTEILDPLRTAFDSPLTGQGWYKEIILLTDGDVGNADEVVGLVASNVHKARVFSIGIGSDASTYLIPAVARAGRGVHAFVRDESQLRAAVVKVLSAALQPRAMVTELKWNLTKTEASGAQSPVSVITAPTLPPPIFNGTYSIVYALYDGDPSTVSGEVTIRMKILDQERTMTISINQKDTMVLPSFENAALHRLAGKCLLNEMIDRYKALQMQQADTQESGENAELKATRAQIEQLSCLINVISPYTSFVGVDPVKQEVLVGPRQESFDVPDCEMLCTMAECCVTDMECAVSVGPPAPPPSAMPFGSLPESLDTPTPPMRIANASEDQPKPKVKPSVLVSLVQYQDFTGFWPLTEDVASLVGLKVDVIRKKKPVTWPSTSDKQLSENVWSTIVVLCYLELKMAKGKDEWTLVARKARNWLKNEVKQAGLPITTAAFDTTLHALLSQAEQLFGKQP